MPVKPDPDELERINLHAVVDLTDTRVLEIGCGEGRLTALYADSAKQVIGTDIEPNALLTAKANLNGYVNFARADAVSLPFSNKSFDVIIFAWSL